MDAFQLDRAAPGRVTGGVLEDLQANILQPHGRRNAAHLLLSFGANGTRLSSIRSWIRRLAAEEITTAASDYAEKMPRRTSFTSLLLTAHGYARLCETAPMDAAFRAGMKSRGAVLQDPPAGEWERPYVREDIDALLIVADDDPVRLALEAVRARVDADAAGIRVIVDEGGHQLRRQGHDIEHFGFVDGISQPEFFEDGQAARRWNAAANLDLVLAEEPGEGGHFGSYLVFRKLV